jgi:hypothetical protein
MTALGTRGRPAAALDQASGAASTTAAPAAVRFRRPGWRDPRLVVGVLLVCVSVVLGAQLLSGRDDVSQVWAVREAVSGGETLSSDDLRAVGVRFAEASDAGRYVSADEPLGPGAVVTRDLAEGELLPLAALGQTDAGLLELPVAVPGGGVPAGLAPGDRVDVWVVPTARASTRSPRADQVLSGVAVLRVGGRGVGGPEAARQVVVGVDPATELAGTVGRLADSHVVLVRRP